MWRYHKTHLSWPTMRINSTNQYTIKKSKHSNNPNWSSAVLNSHRNCSETGIQFEKMSSTIWVFLWHCQWMRTKVKETTSNCAVLLWTEPRNNFKKQLKISYIQAYLFLLLLFFLLFCCCCCLFTFCEWNNQSAVSLIDNHANNEYDAHQPDMSEHFTQFHDLSENFQQITVQQFGLSSNTVTWGQWKSYPTSSALIIIVR